MKTEWEHMTKRGGFLEAKLGKGWSSPFTGYSWKVFRAYVHLVNAWYDADNHHRPHIEAALAEMLATLQPSELPAARMTIYGVGYEGAMLELWPRIEPKQLPNDAAEAKGGA